jgi:hypothetical protein
MDDLERRPGESLEEYIKRLEAKTVPMDAERHKKLRDALNRARDALRRRGRPKPP